MFVDYAGQTLPIVDLTTGEVEPAYLFVSVLGRRLQNDWPPSGALKCIAGRSSDSSPPASKKTADGSAAPS
jgi:hypothetical protein